jgi:hypothetical protein
MTLTKEQIMELTKNGTGFHTDVVLMFDTMADKIRSLETRIKQLEEAHEPAKTTLRVVNDGSG